MGPINVVTAMLREVILDDFIGKTTKNDHQLTELFMHGPLALPVLGILLPWKSRLVISDADIP